jgi:crotonyl-CoA reductase
VNKILDAILASDTTAADFAALEIPESYRAITVR